MTNREILPPVVRHYLRRSLVCVFQYPTSPSCSNLPSFRAINHAHIDWKLHIGDVRLKCDELSKIVHMKNDAVAAHRQICKTQAVSFCGRQATRVHVSGSRDRRRSTAGSKLAPGSGLAVTVFLVGGTVMVYLVIYR